MAYDLEKHKQRIALRSDLTLLLTHLTRARPRTEFNSVTCCDEPVPGQIEASALDVLMEILGNQTLKGSGNKGFIVGDRKAVCFQDTPLYCLGQTFYQERLVRSGEAGWDQEDETIGDAADRPDFHYTLYGVSFTKPYIWKRGGRPVFYEVSRVAKSMLDPHEHWRIVDMDWSNTERLVDWTHEREWRVPCEKDEFTFELNAAYVILPDNKAFRAFLDHETQKEYDLINKLAAVIPVAPVFF